MSVLSPRDGPNGREEVHFGLTIGRMLAMRAVRTPDAGAVVAPGREPLSYARLAAHVDDVAAILRASGLGSRDRIALVLPTGPEMAVAFLAVAAVATCAPLNPSYREDEFVAYLSTLHITALIVQHGGGAAAAAAEKLGIPIIPLAPRPDAGAGVFALERPSGGRSPVDTDDQRGPDDLAVVMLTSGTTSRPKVVPLTHRNIRASAQSTGHALALTPGDRCLNVAPLFHIHGLCMALASLMAGASVICPPAFDARRFFPWLDECRPTWYVAGPPAHREILAIADTPESRAIIARRPLRLIRSGSASLPPSTLHDLERAFGAPVIEAYGLTEAGPLIACNPLPPRARKPGSVGLAAGPEVAIMAPLGVVVAPGVEGEIVARGANIMAGYEGDDAANGEAFVGGWFRTGDLGYLDADGYLFITGRVKEIINRGGQKVSPYEVEAALLDHPAVAQAVVFAAPHATLGEDVAAAVAPRAGMTADAGAPRAHAAAPGPLQGPAPGRDRRPNPGWRDRQSTARRPRADVGPVVPRRQRLSLRRPADDDGASTRADLGGHPGRRRHRRHRRLLCSGRALAPGRAHARARRRRPRPPHLPRRLLQ